MGRADPKRRSAYDRWRCIVRCCYDNRTASYHNYGARGIRVAEEWDPHHTDAAFENFYEWLYAEISRCFEEPPAQFWVVRRDTRLDFTPDNCEISLLHPMQVKSSQPTTRSEQRAVKAMAKANAWRLDVSVAARTLRVPKSRVYRILACVGFKLGSGRRPQIVVCQPQ